MNLNIEVIAFHLREKYEVRISCGKKNGSPVVSGQHEVGRPRFYTDTHDGRETGAASPCLYILPDEVTSVTEGTFLCRRIPACERPENSCFLVVEGRWKPEEIYNELQDIFDLYDTWNQGCLVSISRVADYAALLQRTWETFHCPLLLIDSQFNIIAKRCGRKNTCALFSGVNSLPADLISDLISNPRFRDLENLEGISEIDLDTNYLIYNFHQNGQYIGRLVMPAEISGFSAPQEYLILEHLADYIQLLLERYGSFEMSTSVQGLLHNFLSSALQNRLPGDAEISRLAQSTGWKESDLFLMISFLPEHSLKKELHAPYLISQIEKRWPSACAVKTGDRVSVLLNLTKYGGIEKIEDFYQSLAYFVRDNLLIAGCSRVFSGLRDIAVYDRQTDCAIQFGRKKDRTRWYFLFDHYALDYLVLNGIGDYQPEQICHPAILWLRRLDTEKKTAFYETLLTYFTEEFNMTRAAAKLGIHRSTFINRMDRIEENTGLNLSDYNTRLYLELSFKILELADDRPKAPLYT